MLANFIRDFIDLVIKKKYEIREKLTNKNVMEHAPSPADLIGPTPRIPKKKCSYLFRYCTELVAP
jgi:hypothetical protein